MYHEATGSSKVQFPKALVVVERLDSPCSQRTSPPAASSIHHHRQTTKWGIDTRSETKAVACIMSKLVVSRIDFLMGYTVGERPHGRRCSKEAKGEINKGYESREIGSIGSFYHQKQLTMSKVDFPICCAAG